MGWKSRRVFPRDHLRLSVLSNTLFDDFSEGEKEPKKDVSFGFYSNRSERPRVKIRRIVNNVVAGGCLSNDDENGEVGIRGFFLTSVN